MPKTPKWKIKNFELFTLMNKLRICEAQKLFNILAKIRYINSLTHLFVRRLKWLKHFYVHETSTVVSLQMQF